MSWVRSSFRVTRTMSAGLAAATMVLGPVAQGAQAKKAAVAAAGKTASTTKWVANPIPKVDYNYNIDKQLVQELFAVTGWGKKKDLTVGEFYSKALPYMPKTLARDMRYWAMLNRTQTMPEIQVSSFKASEGKEQVRLILSKNNQTMTLSFDPQSETKFVQANNVDLTKKDMLFHEQAFRKLAKFDKGTRQALLKGPKIHPLKAPIKLTYAEFNRLTLRQQAEYMVEMRYLADATRRVLKAYKKDLAEVERNQDAIEYFASVMLGSEALAATSPYKGASCTINGYTAEYGMTSKGKLSCGGDDNGRAALQAAIAKESSRFHPEASLAPCKPGYLPCSTMAYSVKRNGSRFCAKDNIEEGLYATSQTCPNSSKLRLGDPKHEMNDKKELVENYMRHVLGKKDFKLNMNKEGKISPEQFDEISGFIDGLNTQVGEAIEACKVEPQKSIRKVMDDQEKACAALPARLFRIAKWNVEPTPVVVVPPAVVPDPQPQECMLPVGSTWNGTDCVCEPPTQPGQDINEDGQPYSACIAPKETFITPIPVPVAEPACSYMCGDTDWRGPAAIGGGALLLFWLLNKKDKKKDKPVAVTPPPPPAPPVDPCPPAPLACTPTTPATPVPPPTQMPPPILVAVPETSPSPAPTVAPPPVVVIPEPVPDQPEFAQNVPTSSAGGVR